MESRASAASVSDVLGSPPGSQPGSRLAPREPPAPAFPWRWASPASPRRPPGPPAASPPSASRMKDRIRTVAGRSPLAIPAAAALTATSVSALSSRAWTTRASAPRRWCRLPSPRVPVSQGHVRVLGERLQGELEPLGVGVLLVDAGAEAVSRLGDALRSEQHRRELADHLAVAQVLGLAREQASPARQRINPEHQPLCLSSIRRRGSGAGRRGAGRGARRDFRADF